MQNTSATYNTLLAASGSRFEHGIKIAGTDYFDDVLLSITTDNKIFQNSPTIGGVYSGTCEFSFLSNGAVIPRMAKVIPFYRLVSADGNTHSEWIANGGYYIDTSPHRQTGPVLPSAG